MIRRSKEILSELEIGTPNPYSKQDNALIPGTHSCSQLNLFVSGHPSPTDELRTALEEIDINALTPMEALKKLDELKKKL